MNCKISLVMAVFLLAIVVINASPLDIDLSGIEENGKKFNHSFGQHIIQHSAFKVKDTPIPHKLIK